MCNLLLLEAHDGLLTAVALNWPGRRALTGGDDRMLKLWDLGTGKVVIIIIIIIIVGIMT